MVLPALESFAKWWRLPNVNHLFYHYFYKAAIGDATWKCRLAENKRLGPVILEVYIHAMLCNQYVEIKQCIDEYRTREGSNGTQ
jgi:hypothetical protein